MVKPCAPGSASSRAQHGFGLVEIMIGLLIGLIAVLVIYQVYTVSEGFKRNTTAAGEAQQTGLFSAFVLGMELGNAGAGMAVASLDLASCPDPGGAMPGRFAQSWRPLPVVVADSGNASTPDNFVVNYSMATRLVQSAPFTADPATTSPFFQVQSPTGFQVNDLVLGVSSPSSAPATNPCGTWKVTGVALTSDAQGDVNITPVDVDPPGGIVLNGGSSLLDLGPCDRVQKVMYSVALASDSAGNKSKWDYHPACGPLTPCVLYSTPLLDTQGANCGKPAAPPVANPLAANIVNMKVQFGIDTDKDKAQTIDDWVPATTGTQWGWDNLMKDTTLLPDISRIKAIRIGIIVQSEQFDQTLGDYNWVMFDCSDNVKANCHGRLTGTIAAQASPAGNWRFRKYETVIPLRNAIWNRY
jgi:type IV pilus assembly protein PilW